MYSVSALLLSLVASVGVYATPVFIPGFHGTIGAPASGTVVHSGDNIPFQYTTTNGNECHPGFSAFTVYLRATAPTDAALGSTGSYAAGDYVYDFGEFFVPNFAGLPPISPTPPATLTIPDLAALGVSSGQTLYFTVVDTFSSCPPNSATWYGYSANTVIVG